MKITADTITDEMIRELWTVAGNEMTGPVLMVALNVVYENQTDGRRLEWTPDEVRAARARCAEILNARKESK